MQYSYVSMINCSKSSHCIVCCGHNYCDQTLYMCGFAHMVLHCPTSPLLHWLVLSAEGCTLAGSAAHCQVSVVSVIKFRDGCLWSKCQKIFSRRMRCWEKTEPMWPETWTQKHLALAVVAAEPRCPPAPVLHNPYHPPNSQRNIFWSTAGVVICPPGGKSVC